MDVHGAKLARTLFTTAMKFHNDHTPLGVRHFQRRYNSNHFLRIGQRRESYMAPLKECETFHVRRVYRRHTPTGVCLARVSQDPSSNMRLKRSCCSGLLC